jgi:hypothetical protein
MTRINAKSAEFDQRAPYLRMICPACGRPLPQTSRCVWAMCSCRRGAPLLPGDLGGSTAPASSAEREVQPWRKAGDR